MTKIWTTWISHLRRWGRRCLRLGTPDMRPVGAEGVALLGHREYVGGRWDEIGKMQFEFLRDQGLRPNHVLLDVACGALRAGVHLIPYLEPNHYWGLEKERDLVEAGLSQELPVHVRETRNPRFLINAEFDVAAMDRQADCIWIHSLFTHLPLDLIKCCLTRLRVVAHSGTKCYATFFETMTQRDNLQKSHDHETFFYTRDELTECASRAGWILKYIGDWGHPRGQHMVQLTLCERVSG